MVISTGRYETTAKFLVVRIRKGWPFASLYGLWDGVAGDVLRGSLSAVVKNNNYFPRLTNLGKSANISDSYPSSLVETYLLLDRLHTVLCGTGLLVGDRELPFDFLGRFDGISRSLFGLGIQDARLFLHFLKLAMENSEGYRPDDKKQSGEDNHPPVGIGKPIHGFLWILARAVMPLHTRTRFGLFSFHGSSGSQPRVGEVPFELDRIYRYVWWFTTNSSCWRAVPRPSRTRTESSRHWSRAKQAARPSFESVGSKPPISSSPPSPSPISHAERLRFSFCLLLILCALASALDRSSLPIALFAQGSSACEPKLTQCAPVSYWNSQR